MLKNRQLILIVTGIFQQLFNESLRTSSSSNSNRSFNDHFSLVARHLRNEIITPVDIVRQCRKDRTITNEIGAHRKRYIHRHFCLGNSRENEVYIELRFIMCINTFIVFAKAKYLFELIDQEKD